MRAPGRCNSGPSAGTDSSDRAQRLWACLPDSGLSSLPVHGPFFARARVAGPRSHSDSMPASVHRPPCGSLLSAWTRLAAREEEGQQVFSRTTIQLCARVTVPQAPRGHGVSGGEEALGIAAVRAVSGSPGVFRPLQSTAAFPTKKPRGERTEAGQGMGKRGSPEEESCAGSRSDSALGKWGERVGRSREEGREGSGRETEAWRHAGKTEGEEGREGRTGRLREAGSRGQGGEDSQHDS